MDILLDPHLTCSFPKKVKPMTKREIGRSMHNFNERHDCKARLVSTEDSSTLVERLLLGLGTDTRAFYEILNMNYPGDEIAPDRVQLCKTIAARAVKTGNLLFIESGLVTDLLEYDLQDASPDSRHFLHFLQVKSGWTLTAIGAEDCVYLGDNKTCCIYNGVIDTSLLKTDRSKSIMSFPLSLSRWRSAELSEVKSKG